MVSMHITQMPLQVAAGRHGYRSQAVAGRRLSPQVAAYPTIPISAVGIEKPTIPIKPTDLVGIADHTIPICTVGLRPGAAHILLYL